VNSSSTSSNTTKAAAIVAKPAEKPEKNVTKTAEKKESVPHNT